MNQNLYYTHVCYVISQTRFSVLLQSFPVSFEASVPLDLGRHVAVSLNHLFMRLSTSY